MQMIGEVMQRQIIYDSTLFFCKKLVSEGLLTPEEMNSQKDWLISEYKPLIEH